jgi:hypothetical protein
MKIYCFLNHFFLSVGLGTIYHARGKEGGVDGQR